MSAPPLLTKHMQGKKIMPRYIISRGEYVVHNIIIEADDEDTRS